MIRAGLLALALAAPAAAQDWAGVAALASGLSDPDPARAYRAAVAACLAGQGDAAATAALFTGGGWTHVTDDEPGLDAFDSGNPALYVLATEDGSFCAAFAEDEGTDIAQRNLMLAAKALGVPLMTAPTDLGCMGFTLGPTVAVEVTSSGNDPVCEDAATSSVRFTFTRDQ